MKVTNIIQSYDPVIAGSEKWCEDISRYISQKGHFVKILTTNIYNIEEMHNKLDWNNNHVKLGGIEYDGNILIKRYSILRHNRSLVTRFNESRIFKDSVFGIFIRSPVSFEMYFEMLKELRDGQIVHLHTIPYFHNVAGFIISKILGKKVVITPHFHIGHPHHENKLFFWI